MVITRVDNLRFYDGRQHSIDKNRISVFERKAVLNRFYSRADVDVNKILEDLGPTSLFFSNIQPWGKEFPDIDKRSTRLFTIWGEDETTKEIVVILRGFYVLPPFIVDKNTIKDYYSLSETTSYYPIAVISSYLTILHDVLEICELLKRTDEEIQKNWFELRQNVIASYSKNDLWKRFVLSFDKIIHFSYVCSSFDRELIEALGEKDYRTAGVLQLFASTTPSYDEAMISSHIEEAKKILQGAQEET